MSETYKNNWGHAAEEYNFAGLPKSLLDADDAGQREIIAKNPIQ